MKLSQVILISLSILICFSHTISLAMVMDINEIENRDALVAKLIERNIKLFKSINDPIQIYKCKTFSKFIIDKFKSFNAIFFYLFVSLWPLLLFNFNDWIVPFCALISFLGLIIISFFSTLCLNVQITSNTLSTVKFWKLFADINGYRFFLKIIVDAPIIVAAKNNRGQIIKYLLSVNNCIPDIKDENNFTALDFSNRFNNSEMIYHLLKNENFINFDADKCITSAIIKEWPNYCIELLFDKGGRFTQEDFIEVIEKASFEMVKFLVDLGIDVNVKDKDGTPAIIAAVLHKKNDVVDLLLSRSVDVGIEDAEFKIVSDYLNELPEMENTELIREKFVQFRRKIAHQIYKDLEEFNFAQDQADLISEYLV